MFPPALTDEAARLLEAFRRQGHKVVTAESCTGGLIAGLLTEIPGSSDVVDRGFVTYSNDAKQRVLGVPGDMLTAYGSVSEPVARAMASGALANAAAGVAIAVTGVAGPGGGSAEKPVGLVHLALAQAGKPTLHQECRFGDIGRSAVREKTVEAAVALLWQAVKSS
jgi:nicotinamide-nucleotide amidase